jgi:hypothetical protein
MSFPTWLVVVFAVLGALAGYHLDGRRRGASVLWRGAMLGAVAGLLLSAVLGVVAAAVHLLFALAVAAAIALGLLALIRLLP